MADQVVEREFMGRGRSKIWTYLILIIALVVAVVVINLVWNDPKAASEGIKSFLGLPSWALATVTFLVGALTFWAGLKIETDWPEAIGAVLITASLYAFQAIVGWNYFAVGGLVVLPYILPLAVFAILMMYGMKKSA